MVFIFKIVFPFISLVSIICTPLAMCMSVATMIKYIIIIIYFMQSNGPEKSNEDILYQKKRESRITRLTFPPTLHFQLNDDSFWRRFLLKELAFCIKNYTKHNFCYLSPITFSCCSFNMHTHFLFTAGSCSNLFFAHLKECGGGGGKEINALKYFSSSYQEEAKSLVSITATCLNITAPLQRQEEESFMEWGND